MFELASLSKCFVLFFCFGLIEAKREFRCDYTYYPQADGWLKLHVIPANWHEARLRCQLEGSVLASPITPGIRKVMMAMKLDILNTTIVSKARFLNTTIRYNTPIKIYTGIHSTYSLKDFISVEGVLLSQIHHVWSKGSPYMDIRGHGDCLVMGADGNDDFSGVDGEHVELPFICYKKYQKFTLNECGTVDNEYQFVDKLNSCYKFHHVARPWRDAFKTCAAEGAHLTVINDKAEANFLRAALHKYHIEPVKTEQEDVNQEDEESEKNPEDGATENIIHVGIVRSDVSLWMPMTIFGQTLDEAGYNKMGTKHQSKHGRCGAMDDQGFLIKVDCKDIWYRFLCEKTPGSMCGRKEEIPSINDSS